MAKVPALEKSLVIACGALAHEITALLRLNGWNHLEIQCLPASLHNQPRLIAPAVREKVHQCRGQFKAIFVAYADCGTGGQLDKVLAEEKLERLPGAHCYEFFWGSHAFLERHEREPGVFYLTDFLARHFDRLVMDELGINRHPQLLETYFSAYSTLIYLAQTESPQTLSLARSAAQVLGLEFEVIRTGYGALEVGLAEFSRASEGMMK
jgi:hypothetical protein